MAATSLASKKRATPTAERANPQALRNAETSCIVAPGTSIEGDFRSEENIRLDGRVKGMVRCTKRLVVGEKGQVEGDVKASTAVVAGKVMGNLTVEGALQLTSTARIEGDITAKLMTVDEGALYNGVCKIGG